MPTFFPVDPSDVETFTMVTNPVRSYISSSTSGPTGSIMLFAQRSPVLKDPTPDSSFVEAAHDDAHISEALRQAQQAGRLARSSPALQGTFGEMVNAYLDKVDAEGQSLRLQQQLDVIRFTPPADFNSNTLRKLIVKDQLNSFYRTSVPSAHWAYTNYNTLNFFTASCVPASSALLYPNVDRDEGGITFHEGYCSGTYTPSGSFSFDFYVNPRYQTIVRDGAFKAGTILHLSSTFALSLVSGSSKDANGLVDCFRLQLQLSHSADVPPSLAVPGSFPSDLIFLSNDNSLRWNCWHHVVVRWGTKDLNGGTGTFNVDGVDAGTFLIPSSTIAPKLFTNASFANPDILCVGNYYEGKNTGVDAQAYFFANDPALRDGLNQLIDDVGGINEPVNYAFNHPLNAELHDVAIRRTYMSDKDIAFSSSRGPAFLDNTFSFYVPPFFVSQSPYRQFVGDYGGILVTPFEEIDGATTAPFSVALSFGVAGHLINLENFVKDFAGEIFPRLHQLTASAIQDTTDAETANQFLMAQPFVVRRNLSLLPCDDGNFVPSFQLLASESLLRALDDLGVDELSLINLDNMVNTATLLFGAGAFDDGSQPASSVNAFANAAMGYTPETPFDPAGSAFTNYASSVVSGSDVEAGAPLAVYQRTQDPSSNQMTFFDISNIFYGFRIDTGTLTIDDPDLVSSMMQGSNLSGAGPISISLTDDGNGNVYRADCFTSQSSWNSVGNLYYDEGLLVVKSPHLFFFGQGSYQLDFRGEQHVHVMKIDAFAPNNQLNSSSNPNFAAVPPNGYPNDPEDSFVYITGFNLHDTDYNVVMKSTLAQPIMKRSGDALLFKTRLDF